MTFEWKRMPAFSAIGYCLRPPEGIVNPLDNGAYWLRRFVMH